MDTLKVYSTCQFCMIADRRFKNKDGVFHPQALVLTVDEWTLQLIITALRNAVNCESGMLNTDTKVELAVLGESLRTEYGEIMVQLQDPDFS